MQVCKYASLQVCKYVSMHLCKYASMHICQYVHMQVYKYANIVTYFIKLPISCKKLVTFRDYSATRNFFNYWHLVDVGTGYWVLVTEYCILGLDTEYWVLSTGHWVVGIFAVKRKVSLLKDRVPLITIWFFKHSKIHPFTIFTIGKVTFGLESLFKKLTSWGWAVLSFDLLKLATS